jgi:RimJ/RimL family protein N-acetyltransferase
VRKAKFIEGKNIALRPMQASDINDRYLSWLNDRKVTEYMETGIFPSSLDDLKGFYKKMSQSKNDVMFTIITRKGSVHIGNIKLGGINWIHRYADLGIMVGDKKYWGKGYGTEACRLMLEYAFNVLNLNKVILGVYAPHQSAIKAYQKAGFRMEGRYKKIYNCRGKFVDKICMGILKSEFTEKNKKTC